MLPFENIEIAAPAMYHEALTAQFGDYMVPVKGAADHDYPFYGHMEGELKNRSKRLVFMEVWKNSVRRFPVADYGYKVSTLVKQKCDSFL